MSGARKLGRGSFFGRLEFYYSLSCYTSTALSRHGPVQSKDLGVRMYKTVRDGERVSVYSSWMITAGARHCYV